MQQFKQSGSLILQSDSFCQIVTVYVSIVHVSQISFDRCGSATQFSGSLLNDCPGENLMPNIHPFFQKIFIKIVGSFAKIIGFKGYIPFPEDHS
jgi:hypothetical protein